MRLPSLAEPHCRPPVSPPGPTFLFQTSAPVSRLSAQKSPLFSPAPTRSVFVPLAVVVKSIGACPKS